MSKKLDEMFTDVEDEEIINAILAVIETFDEASFAVFTTGMQEAVEESGVEEKTSGLQSAIIAAVINEGLLLINNVAGLDKNTSFTDRMKNIST